LGKRIHRGETRATENGTPMFVVLGHILKLSFAIPRPILSRLLLGSLMEIVSIALDDNLGPILLDGGCDGHGRNSE
jgi:hypothetical protein